MATARLATRRLLREFETWQAEQEALDAARTGRGKGGEQGPADDGGYGDSDGEDDNSPNKGIERLGPAADADDLFHWQAVVNGRGVGGGYDAGRWLLDIQLPAQYPNQPPTIRFVTPVLHANVHPKTGEVCLDLLQGAWTPALTVAACVRAVRLLLSAPGADSPLNIDLAALLRAGDTVAAARLVQLWCEEQRYQGA